MQFRFLRQAQDPAKRRMRLAVAREREQTTGRRPRVGRHRRRTGNASDQRCKGWRKGSGKWSVVVALATDRGTAYNEMYNPRYGMRKIGGYIWGNI